MAARVASSLLLSMISLGNTDIAGEIPIQTFKYEKNLGKGGRTLPRRGHGRGHLRLVGAGGGSGRSFSSSAGERRQEITCLGFGGRWEEQGPVSSGDGEELAIFGGGRRGSYPSELPPVSAGRQAGDLSFRGPHPGRQRNKGKLRSTPDGFHGIISGPI